MPKSYKQVCEQNSCSINHQVFHLNELTDFFTLLKIPFLKKN